VSWINAWWQQVSGTATQGLQVTFVGMSLVFLTLGLIILVLTLLTRLPGLREEREEQVQGASNRTSPPSEPRAKDVLPPSTADTEVELAKVAAIAVALVLSQPSGYKRSRVQPPVSKWKQYGRAHQLGL
jgi:Na+-transporting methylmalonyl-CoA/oxaloacetate decarboxylase gamma subunit